MHSYCHYSNVTEGIPAQHNIDVNVNAPAHANSSNLPFNPFQNTLLYTKYTFCSGLSMTLQSI